MDDFTDSTGTYLTDTSYSGVWLSNVPLDYILRDALLQVELNLSIEELEEYECVEDEKTYREFLIPSEIVNNRITSIRIVDNIVMN